MFSNIFVTVKYSFETSVKYHIYTGKSWDRYCRCVELLCCTFHRKQAFLRGVTIEWDLARFHYAHNDVFARLRLVISRRFRLVESTVRTSRRYGACATVSNNGQRSWYCSPICDSNSLNSLTRKDDKSLAPSGRSTRYPLIASSLYVAFSSAELYKRTPETLSFTTLTTCLDVPRSVPRYENSTSNAVVQHNVKNGRRRQRRLVRGRGLISVRRSIDVFERGDSCLHALVRANDGHDVTSATTNQR